MKDKVGPGTIAVAAVALIVVLFAIYHFAFRGNPAQPAVTPDNRPDYVKQLQAGGRPSWPASGPQEGQPQAGAAAGR